MKMKFKKNHQANMYKFLNYLLIPLSFFHILFADTSYEKACRRGSAPATPILGQKQQQQENNTTSRFTNFFSKR